MENNYANRSYENENALEQPVDYSQKYNESKSFAFTKQNDENNYSFRQKTGESVKSEKYSSYAETDLDQPTDYSLRYAEDDSDSDICTPMTKNENVDFIQDTVKTYCTEGTPYETPFNFSTSTSMSDLRLEQNSDKQLDNSGLQSNFSEEEVNISGEDKNHAESSYETNESANKFIVKTMNSQLSSGLLSPEKPINYCEEGTPGYFSRVSSFESLEFSPTNEDLKPEIEIKEEISDDVKNETVKCIPSTSEAKTVKFGQVVNYAEETPLMFSRSSSLASLDSIEQHSIHDDGSSIVSTFSRLTSGIVSPSELPDSPTQMLPQSPKLPKHPNSDKNCLQNMQEQQQKSVFEDNVTKFKEESTPAHFSTATSLSSLTIDDHCELRCSPQNNIQSPLQQLNNDGNANEIPQRVQSLDYNEYNDDFSQASEDEDMLAACINIGMQKSRHFINNPSSFQNEMLLLKSQPNNSEEIDHYKNSNNMHSDTVRTYYTEDTPIGLSHACSHSDLSMLSIPENDVAEDNKKEYLSDESSNLSGEDDKILAECIKSAMPKARKNNNIDDDGQNNKSILSLDFNNVVCKTAPAPQASVSSTPSDCLIKSDSKNTQIYPEEDFVQINNPGSNSDMSESSVQDDKNDASLLEACIKSGMPKPRKIEKAVTKATMENKMCPNFNVGDSKTSSKSNNSLITKFVPTNKSSQQHSASNFVKIKPPSNIKYLNNQNNIALKQTVLNNKPAVNNCKILSTSNYNVTHKLPSKETKKLKPKKTSKTSNNNQYNLSENNLLSEEEENILSECIKSAMPKPKKSLLKITSNIKNSNGGMVTKSETKATKSYSKSDGKLSLFGWTNDKIGHKPKSHRKDPAFSSKNCLKEATGDFIRQPVNKQKANLNKMSITFTRNDKVKTQQNSSAIPLPKNWVNNITSPSKSSNFQYSDSVKTYCTEDTPAVLSSAGSISDLNTLLAQDAENAMTKKGYDSDESSNLTDEDDKILAECIKSAMPKPKCPSSLPVKSFQTGIPKKTDFRIQSPPKNNKNVLILEANPSVTSDKKNFKNEGIFKSGYFWKRKTSHQNSSTEVGRHKSKNECNMLPLNSDRNNSNKKELISPLSLSEESLNISDNEQALLQQCISSAMPKSSGLLLHKKKADFGKSK